MSITIVFEVVAGPTWRDPWTVPAPLRGEELVKPIRVAMVLDPADQGTAGQVQDGLPQAVQVIGPRYREDLCLDAAAAIEDRVGILTPIDPR